MRLENTVSLGLYGKPRRRCGSSPGRRRRCLFTLLLSHLVEKSQGFARQPCPFWLVFFAVAAAPFRQRGGRGGLVLTVGLELRERAVWAFEKPRLPCILNELLVLIDLRGADD